MPTHDIGIEQAVLGAMLLDNEAYFKVSRVVGPEDFYDPVHAHMFATAGETIASGRVFDPKTARNLLGRIEGIDVAGYLSRLVEETASVIAAPSYASVIAELSAKRRLAAACDRVREHVLNGTGPIDAAAELEDEITDIRAALRRDGDGAMSHHGKSMLEDLAEAYKRHGYDGVPWPLPELDLVMSGPMEAGNLYGFLGASGEGKSSALMQIARHSAEAGHPTLVISYDQTAKQCLRQMCSQALGIPVNDLRRGQVEEKDFDRVVEETQRLVGLPLEIEKIAHGKVGRVISSARAFVRRRKTKLPALVIVDHIKRIEPERVDADAGSRVNAITAALKAMSEDLGCATLLANQRNSRGLGRPSARPIAEDLFGGQSAQEDYDAILYLYREEKWLKDKLKIADRESEKDRIESRIRIVGGKAEFGALKNRWGDPSRTETVEFKAEHTRFISQLGAREAREPDLI